MEIKCEDCGKDGWINKKVRKHEESESKNCGNSGWNKNELRRHGKDVDIEWRYRDKMYLRKVGENVHYVARDVSAFTTDIQRSLRRSGK